MGRKQSQSAEVVWRDRFARFHKSNLTVTQFCQQEGVSGPTFYQWRKRLKQDRKRRRPVGGPPKTVKSPPFVPVSIPSSTFAEVEFPNGVRIRVPASNAEALRVAILAGHEVCREVR